MTGINDLGNEKEEMSALDEEDKELTKEEHAVNYAKALGEIDRCMEPFREHRSDLKKSYQENRWLSKEEMTTIAKAYRALKNDESVEDVLKYLDLLKSKNVKA